MNSKITWKKYHFFIDFFKKFHLVFNKKHSKNQMLVDNIFSFHYMLSNNSCLHNHQMNLEFLQFLNSLSSSSIFSFLFCFFIINGIFSSIISSSSFNFF